MKTHAKKLNLFSFVISLLLGTVQLGAMNDSSHEELIALAENNDPQAQYLMGKKYEKISEAFPWLEKSANGGFAPAQHTVGWCYDHGFGVTKNKETAFEWFLKAAAMTMVMVLQ